MHIYKHSGTMPLKFETPSTVLPVCQPASLIPWFLAWNRFWSFLP